MNCKGRVGKVEENSEWLGRFKGVLRYRFGKLFSEDKMVNLIPRGEK